MKKESGQLYLKRLGVKVKTARLTVGMTQEQVADVTGFHRTYISQTERGLTNPTLVNLFELAEGLNTHVSLLIEDIFEEDSDKAVDPEVNGDNQ